MCQKRDMGNDINIKLQYIYEYWSNISKITQTVKQYTFSIKTK